MPRSVTHDAIVIGAGIAGLAAAYALTQAGWRVRVLEARPRVGGRIWTVRSEADSPVELGAEFVHGMSAEIWDFIDKASLTVSDVQSLNAHRQAKAVDASASWDDMFTLLPKLGEHSSEDESVADAAEPLRESNPHAVDALLLYIENYHASDATKISTQAILKAEAESDGGDGSVNHRLVGGYQQLSDWLARELGAEHIALNSIVTRVSWDSDGVTVECSEDGTTRRYEAHSAVVTLPLGVLQASPGEAGFVEFQPPLPKRDRALEKLEMGAAIHVALEFERSLLDEAIFAARSAAEPAIDRIWTSELIRVWWLSQSEPTIVWVGWLGGPNADHLSKLDDAALINKALDMFARGIHTDKRNIERHFKKGYYHNWRSDPFARGAYSYIKAGGLDAQQELEKPVANTLFFAGEMIPGRGQTGTVSGAIRSGLNAAAKLIATRAAKTDQA